MINLIGQWIGNVYGTHPSNVFAEFNKQNGEMSVSIRSATPLSNEVSIFIGICTQNEKSIAITINELVNGQQTTTTGNATLNVISENQLEGNFEFNNQAKGIIKISRFLFTNSINEQSQPLQIIAKEIILNYPLKIYKKDIQKIITIMQELATPAGTLVITEQSKGTKIIKYSNDYLKVEEHQENVDSLSFTSQVMVHGFTNTLTLNLNRNSPSYIISQSTDFLWSHTTPILLKETLEQKTTKLLGLYKRFGLEINGFLFLILLIILPSFEFKTRLVFVTGFLVFAFSYRVGYRHLSQTILEANADKPTKFREKYPKITYIALTIFSLLVGAIISYGVDKVMTKLSAIIINL